MKARHTVEISIDDLKEVLKNRLNLDMANSKIEIRAVAENWEGVRTLSECELGLKNNQLLSGLVMTWEEGQFYGFG